MPFLRRASAGLLALSTLFVLSLPLASQAAAPSRQAIFNLAMSHALNGGAIAANGQLKLTIQLRGAKSTDPSGSVDLAFNVANRLQANATDTRGDARLTLTSATFKTALNGNSPVSGSVSGNGAAVESRVVGNLLYIRVNNITPDMQQGAADMGLDLSALQGHWIIFPIGILRFSNQLPFLMPVSQTVSSAAAQQGGATKNVLMVTKLEKTWTDASGHNLFRVRLGLNTALLSSLQAAELKTAKQKNPKDKAALTAIANRYALLKKSLQSTDAVAEVDATSAMLTRLELGSSSSQTLKSCAKNAAGKQTCRTTGTLTTRWNGGFMLGPDSSLAIAPPTADAAVNVASK